MITFFCLYLFSLYQEIVSALKKENASWFGVFISSLTCHLFEWLCSLQSASSIQHWTWWEIKCWNQEFLLASLLMDILTEHTNLAFTYLWNNVVCLLVFCHRHSEKGWKCCRRCCSCGRSPECNRAVKHRPWRRCFLSLLWCCHQTSART